MRKNVLLSSTQVFFMMTWLVLQACGVAATSSETKAISAQKARPYSAKEAQKNIGPGINMGNVFERGSNPNSASMTKALIDMYLVKKIKHVRIPVTWIFDDQKSLEWSKEDDIAGPIANQNGQINYSHKRFTDLRDTIDYALENNMHVILNVHHERDLKSHYDESDKYKVPFTTLWTEIATYFKNRYADKVYSYHLLFEVLNEPEGAFGDFIKSEGIDWTDQDGIKLTRKINEIGYNAIRKVDANRIILVSPNTQGNIRALANVYPDDSSLPGDGDDKLMVSVHTYDPWNFAGQEGTNDSLNNSEDEVKAAVRSKVKYLTDWAAINQTPIHVGEFGVGRSTNRQFERNTDVARAYYYTMAENLAAHGFIPTAWDDQGWFALTKLNGKDKYPSGLIDSYLDGYQNGLKRKYQ